MVRRASKTAKVGYTPKIKVPRREIDFDMNMLMAPGPRTYAPEDIEIMDAYVTLSDEIHRDMDEIDGKLDEALEDLEIPYDPNAFPQLYDAHHCPNCGIPKAPNIITYAAMQQRENTKRAQMRQAVLGGKDSPLAKGWATENFTDLTATDLASISSKSTEKMVKEMLDATWKQILIWVLEFTLKYFGPLKKVKFVKVIPNLIKRAIARLKGKTSRGTWEQEKDEEIEMSDEGEMISGEDLAKEGDGYIANLSELDSAIAGGMKTMGDILHSDKTQDIPSKCYAHTAVWEQSVGVLLTDNPKYTPFMARKLNLQMRERLEAMDRLAGAVIPDQYVVEPKDKDGNPIYKPGVENGKRVKNEAAGPQANTAITWSNPLPDEYLQARADGSTKTEAFGQGLVASLGDFKKDYLPQIKQFVNDMMTDPMLFCCLLRNLGATWNSQKLRRILLYIQGLLQMWRNIQMLDLNEELAMLSNMVMDLLSQVLQSIFTMYSTLFLNTLNKGAIKMLDLKNMNAVGQCLPWQELLDLAQDILKQVIDRIVKYLTGFFINFRLDVSRGENTAKKLINLQRIEKLLDLINKIIQFAAAWAVCVDNAEDPKNNIMDVAKRLTVVNGALVLGAPSTTATKNRAGSKNSFVLSPAIKDAAARAGEEAFSAEGLNIFLTGFAGASKDQAKQALETMDDCACEKALTKEELSLLEKAIARGNQ